MGTTTENDTQDTLSMGQISAKTPQTTSQEEEVFYGVHLPNSNEDDFLHVYTDKCEALKVVKNHKKARFKPFRSRSDAVTFARFGSESSGSGPDESTTSITSVTITVSDAEKPSPFKGPKAQDMVRLRRAIESGDVRLVRNTVWANPRYLISSGDTPSILQEGSRYNALHVAAKSKNAAMAELVLQTVGDPSFCRLLYGEEPADKPDTNIERAAVLLDLYLNTPDKGMHETPLHFAVKFGAVEVVSVLVSYAQCDRQPKNKFGQLPIDIVAARCPTIGDIVKKKILSLLEDEFYVPVVRAQDNSLQALIGQPFSPKEPPLLNADPVSPRLEIHAFAGPMSQDKANVFHRQWRTPQRLPLQSPAFSSYVLKSCPPSFRLTDREKGLERVGRELAAKHEVPWKEYWPFLDTFIDLSSEEGLQQLEDYLHQRFQSVQNKSNSNDVQEIGYQSSPLLNESQDILKVDQSLDCSDFEPEILSPVTQLCSMMKACTILDDSLGSGRGRGSPSSSLSSSPSSSSGGGSVLSSSPGRFFNWLNRRSSSAEKKTTLDSKNEAILTALSQPALSPFLYVEKSLQLFAKRIAASLHHVVSGITTHHVGDAIRDVLRPEVKRVQSLVRSYMEDARFVAVDYHLVHSRVASSVAERLVCQLTPEERELFYRSLQDVLASKGVLDATVSSDEEEHLSTSTPYRQSRPVRQSCSGSQRTAVRCIASQMVWALDQLPGSGPDGQSPLPPRPQVRTESECLEMWSDAYPCLCSWPSYNQNNFSRGSRKSSSMKHSINSSSASDSKESVSRRLNYEEDMLVDASKRSQVDSNKSSEKTDLDEDTFFTPPSSPSRSPAPCQSLNGADSDSDDMDVPEEGPSVFLEGEEPTRLDRDVVNAISGCQITPASHPHIYRWRHEVMLHAPAERERWQSSARKRSAPGSPRRQINSTTCTPCTPASLSVSSCGLGFETHTPMWTRITGHYSPHLSQTRSVDQEDHTSHQRNSVW